MTIARKSALDYSCLLLFFFLLVTWSGTAAALQPSEPVKQFKPPGAPAPALDGFWKGPLKVPGGELEVIYRLVALTNGEYYATLDVPQQKASHLTVEATVRADSVVLVCEEANSRFVGQLQPGGNELRGTWRQPGLQTALALTRSAAPALPPPRSVAPYREETVTFPNALADLRLGGTLLLPTGTGPFAAVVLLADTSPRFGEVRNEGTGGFRPLHQLADYLARHGVGALVLDSRGEGRSGGSALATPTDRATDAQAALSYLRARPEIDLAHLGLIGHGEGGTVALLTATQPLPPAFVVGLAPPGLPGSALVINQQQTLLRAQQLPAPDVNAAVRRQQAMFDIIRNTTDNVQAQAIVANMLRQQNPTLPEATVQVNAAELVSARYRFFLAYDPIQPLVKVNCPVLLLFGSADAALNPEANLEALGRGLRANRSVLVKRFAGVNHFFEADPMQWPLLNGTPRPIFSPAAAGTIRTWIATQAVK